jgi:molybdopterin molybdotransferase
MLTMAQALDALMAGVRPITDSETVDTLQANGRVLAAGVTSALRVPPADNTSMDGYAMRAADVPAPGTRLPVSADTGRPRGHRTGPGTAARIFTGGLIPPGADAVVMQEQCQADGDAVIVNHVPASGEWIRRAGEDIEAGSEILPAGTRLSPQALGLAASVGRRSSTWSAACAWPCSLPATNWRCPASRSSPARSTTRTGSRCAVCWRTSAAKCRLRHRPDTLAATRDTLRRAAEGNDLIITSGGVSVGEEDHIRPAVTAEGRLDLWQIAIKPGKPLAFGQVANGTELPRFSWACRAIPCRASSHSCCSCARSSCVCRASRT